LAYRAIIALGESGGRTLDMLHSKLRPVTPVPADRLAHLIAELDAPAFNARQ
jgi:hypothetical protein